VVSGIFHNPVIAQISPELQDCLLIFGKFLYKRCCCGRLRFFFGMRSQYPDQMTQTKPQVVQTCAVLCRDAAVEIQWSLGDPPLLDKLETAGLTPAYSCRAGQCHSCVTELLAGAVAHPEEVTDPGPGHCLLCCAVPVTERLELAL